MKSQVTLLSSKVLHVQSGARRVGSGDGAVGIAPVSISCLIKPCMRFSRTRLTDNLLSAAFKVHDLLHPAGKIFL